VSSTATRTVTITLDRGYHPTDAGFVVPTPGFVAVLGTCTPSATGACALTVSYIPTAPGPVTNTLWVKECPEVGPDPCQNVYVNLHATGVAPLTVSPISLPDGTVGRPYQATLSASGGTAPVTWSVTAGKLPAGLTLDAATGALSGAPTTAGAVELTFTATDHGRPTPQAATVTSKLTVQGPPAITSAGPARFTTGRAGTFTITTRAGVPAATTLTLDGTLPDGITFTDKGDGTATLSGTPAASTVGSHPVTITASNGVEPAVSQRLTIVVAGGAPPTTPPRSPAGGSTGGSAGGSAGGSTGGGSSNGGGSTGGELAGTGPSVDVSGAIRTAAVLLLAGLVLVGVARRRRNG
jgi:uncharacterized membrane protein YgcG